MNESDAFRRASDGFMERARRIKADQWSAATPCSEWDVRALVNHVGGEYLWVEELMAGKTIAEVGDRLNGDVLGDDPLSTLDHAQRAAVAALAEPDALNRTVHLSFGDTPASEYASQMFIDSVIHAWDLARAIGADETIDPELVDMAYAALLPQAEQWRSGGVFGPEKQPAEDSTQAKLLALSGR